jgi:hypothetical protein
MKRSVLALALMLAPSGVWAGAYHVLGAGVASCGSYLNYRTIPDAEAITMNTLSWLEGYLTAYNKYAARSGDVMAGKLDVDSLRSWLDDYCKAHPSEDMVTAAQGLIAQLKSPKR